MENCPYFCDFAHLFVILGTFRLWISEPYWAVWQTGQLWSEHALNHKKTTESQKLEFCPSLPPSNAHIFVQKMPVLRPSFYKNELFCRIGNTVAPLIHYNDFIVERTYSTDEEVKGSSTDGRTDSADGKKRRGACCKRKMKPCVRKWIWERSPHTSMCIVHNRYQGSRDRLVPGPGPGALIKIGN